MVPAKGTDLYFTAVIDGATVWLGSILTISVRRCLMKTNHADTRVETDFDSREAIDALNLDLRESDARYRTLFDLVPVAVYTIDRAGVIQNFNCSASSTCSPSWTRHWSGRRPGSA
jgi:PAS domain-containing protein